MFKPGPKADEQKDLLDQEDSFTFKVLRGWLILTEGDTLGAKQVFKRCEKLCDHALNGGHKNHSHLFTGTGVLGKAMSAWSNLPTKSDQLRKLNCSVESMGNLF